MSIVSLIYKQSSLDLEKLITKSTGIIVENDFSIGEIAISKNDWCPLSKIELSNLIKYRDSISKDDISIIGLNNTDVDGLSKIRLLLLNNLHEAVFSQNSHTVRYLIDEAIVHCLASVEMVTKKRIKKLLHARLGINPPNLRSTAFNVQNKTFMGLHYDKYKKHSSDNDIFHLIGINFGLCERFFCFSRLLPCAFSSRQTETYQQEKVPDSSVTGIGSYLSLLYNEPIYRIKIEPLHAYIAPVQRIIHDGMTNQRGMVDICLFIAVKFYED